MIFLTMCCNLLIVSVVFGMDLHSVLLNPILDRFPALSAMPKPAMFD